MSYNIDPYDVMDYHHTVSEFIEPTICDSNKNSFILQQIDDASHSINRFFREETLDYTYSLRNVVILGNAIDSIHEIPIVDPNGDSLDQSISEIYAGKLLNEENPWDHIYELEVAQICHSVGLDTKLVHEGNISGPDVFVDCDNTRINIECKRRRSHDPETHLGNPYNLIKDRIDNSVNIGEDSYFIELTSDKPLEEKDADELANLAVDVIEHQYQEKTKTIGDVTYKVILHDYISGKSEVDVSRDDLEFWFNYSGLSPHSIQKMLSPFDHDQTSPGALIDFGIKFTDEGKTVLKEGSVLDFNFPTIDSKFYDRIINTTFRKGRQDLSGCSPAVLFIHLPAYEIEDMDRYHVQEADYDPTRQTQRLDQRIEGQLKHSNSINAVVANTTYFNTKGNNCEIRRGFKMFKNPSPELSLPDDFEAFLSGDYF